MHQRGLRTLLFAILTLASTARADFAIAWRNFGGADSRPSQDQRQQAFAFAQEASALLQHHDLIGAEGKLQAALALYPEKGVWWFNLACIQNGHGAREAAVASLRRATEVGFTDFAAIDRDNGLRALLDHPAVKKLLSDKVAIIHRAAQRAIDELRRQFGPDYLYEADEERKLVFAVVADGATLDALRAWLADQEASQCAELFVNRPDEFIRVVLPSIADYHRLIRLPGVRGIYEDATRTLLVDQMGQVMTHEFTHALHAADQRAVGQEHPIWLREGLASMYEAGDFENGQLIPRDNYRLGFVQAAARRHTLIPLDRVLQLTPKDFLRGPNLAYGQTSSLLLYLHDQKLLGKFYAAYKAGYGADASGRAALEATTGQSLVELEKTWTAWMLTRSNPNLGMGLGGNTLGIHFGNAVDGLRITIVLPNGPGAKAGLRRNDVIVGFDNRDVRDYASLAPMLAAHKAGDSAKIKVRRDGEYIELPIEIAAK